MTGEGWIGVDLDGTLAHYDSWKDGSIGAPIPKMVERVKAWLAKGKTVKIVTARVSALFDLGHDPQYMPLAVVRIKEAQEQEEAIRAWCIEHLGQTLAVTAIKDFGMIELWDDRAVQVVQNTGETLIEYMDTPAYSVTDKRRFIQK